MAVVTYLTTQSNQAFSADGGSSTFQTLVFANGNGVTFSNSNGSIMATVAPGGGAPVISAGGTSGSLSQIVFSNSNSVSFGLSGSTITASINAPAQTVQTQNMVAVQGSTGSISFANSNGITFGGNNSTITASHNGLTSQSNQAFSAPGGSSAFQTLEFVNTNGVSFSNSNGSLYASVATNYQSTGNYLTTAAQSNQVVNSINGSTGQFSFNSGSSLSSSRNGNSITFGLASDITTALQSAGAYITTAAQSNQVVNSINGTTGQFSFATGSSLSSSINGNSITWGLASNITTALQSTGAYLTTAAQSNQVVNSINGSTGVFTFNTGSSLSSSRNGNSITWGLASNITTALQSAGAYLTTARASTDAIGLNTAGTNVTWTANSSGLSINAAGYAGTATTFAGTNVSASLTLNSLGLNMALSAGGAGGTTNQTGPNIAAGSQTATSGTVIFSNSNGITFGMNNTSVITASFAPTPVSESMPYFQLPVLTNNSTAFGNSSIYFVPFDVCEDMYIDRVNFFMSVGTTSSAASTITATFSQQMGLYSRGTGTNTSRMELIKSSEGYLGFSLAATSNSIIHPNGRNSDSITYATYDFASAASQITTYLRDIIGGARAMQIPVMTTLTAGHYWLGYGIKTTHGTGTASWNIRVSYHLQSLSGMGYLPFNATITSSASNQATMRPAWGGFGSYSAQTAALPANVALNGTDIKNGTAMFIPLFNFSGWTTNNSNI